MGITTDRRRGIGTPRACWTRTRLLGVLLFQRFANAHKCNEVSLASFHACSQGIDSGRLRGYNLIAQLRVLILTSRHATCWFTARNTASLKCFYSIILLRPLFQALRIYVYGSAAPITLKTPFKMLLFYSCTVRATAKFQSLRRSSTICYFGFVLFCVFENIRRRFFFFFFLRSFLNMPEADEYYLNPYLVIWHSCLSKLRIFCCTLFQEVV